MDLDTSGATTATKAPITLLVEPTPAGHRLYYVHLLINEIRSKGGRAVILTTTSAIESANWAIHLSRDSPEMITHPPNAFTLDKIAGISASLGANVTVIPNADHQLLATIRRGWKGPGELKLLVMRAEAGQPGPPLALMRPAKTALKRLLVSAAGLRPRVQVFALRNPLSRRRGTRWIADPITFSGTSLQRQAMRERLSIHGDRYWLGVFGAICVRKNLPLILEAIGDQPGVGLLIAGHIEPVVEEAIAPLLLKFASTGGAVIKIPGPIEDVDFDSAIGAVDCVIVAQLTEGSSSIVLRAAALGRRLILAGANSLRHDAAKLGHQATWTPLDVDAIRLAVEQARCLPEPGVAIELNAEEFLWALG